MKKYLPILQNCPLFENVASADLTAMLACLNATLIERSKHEVIFHEGDSARQVGILLSGAAQIVKDDFYGNRSIVASVSPGHLFGEAFACANVAHLPVSVIAVEKSEILLIDCRRITQTCSNACEFHNRLVMNLLSAMAEKNLQLNRKIECMSRRTTREKLMAFLLSEAKARGSREFDIPFDRQALADYLAVERSAMSAELGKLVRDGVIACERRHFRLL